MRKLIEILFLVLPMSMGAMHDHESSSASLSQPQQLTVEQELKIADELSSRAQIETLSEEIEKKKNLSKQDQVNNFRRECLNEHLIDELSNLVIEYDDIGQYSCFQTLDDGNYIWQLTQLQDGSLVSKDNWKFTIWRDHQYHSGQYIHSDGGPIRLIQLKNGLLATFSLERINIWSFIKDKYYCVQSLFNKSMYRCIYDLAPQLFQLQDGSLVCLSPDGLTIWHCKNHEYTCVQNLVLGNEYRIYKLMQLKNDDLVVISDVSIRILSLKNGQYVQRQFINVFCRPDSVIALKDNSLAFWGKWDESCENGHILIYTLQKNEKYSLTNVFNNLLPCNITELQDGSLIFNFNQEGIKIWQFKISKHIQTLIDDKIPKDIKSIIQLQDGSLVLYNETKIIILVFKNGKYCFYQTLDHGSKIEDVIKLQDGSLASYSRGGKIKIWKQKELVSLKIPIVFKRPIMSKKELNKALNDALDQFDESNT